MQNTFSFSRLWLLIKKQWFDNSRLYALSASALIGILTIIFTIWWLANKFDYHFEEITTNVIFFVMLFVTGLIFSSTTFSTLGDKAKGLYWLSVPATAIEKLVCGIFYSCLVFLAIYFTSFWLIKHIFFFIIELDPRNTIRRIDPNDVFEREVTPILFYIFFALQALFILGSVYFERFAFIKTLLVAVFIAFLFVMFTMFLGHNLLPNNLSVKGFSDFRVYGDNEPPKLYRLPGWIDDVLVPIAKFIWVPVFLTATYFRLKEKEI
jgi:hypothetical protein